MMKDGNNIEIFKTNISNSSKARVVKHELSRTYPGARIDVDLQDCDKVLRVEGPMLDASQIIRTLHKNGLDCAELI